MNSGRVEDPRSDKAWLGVRTVNYTIVGVLAGILFPAIAIAIKLAQLHLPVNIANIIVIQRTEPLMWIIETAPFFLGSVAALAGRRQDLTLDANKALTSREAELTSIRSELEHNVSQRTQELDVRNAQMRAVIHFARQIADIQDLPSLLNTAVRSLLEQFNWHEADIYLLDATGQSATLRASASSAGRNPLKEGYRIAMSDQNAIGRVVRRGRLYVSAPQPGRHEQHGRTSTAPTSASQITLPLMARGKAIGALDIRPQESQAIGQSEAELLQLVADQLAASIENARLVSETLATADQLRALTLEDTKAAWQKYLKNRELAYQFTPSGINALPNAQAVSSAGRLSVPLLLRGQRIGSISIHSRTGESWTEVDQELMDKVAVQVALALENARLLEETRQRAAQEQVVSEISARLNRSLEVDAVLQSAVREFAALPDVAEAEVVLTAPDDRGPQSRN